MTAMAQTSSDGWADVLGAHRGDLVRTARSRLGSGGADAEDVVHDVVVRVLRGRRDAAEMATPGAYLRRAVGNECVSRWRRTSREVVLADLPDRPRPAADEAVLDKLVLGEAVRTLTPRQRRVIALTVLDDRPDGEVAAELGVSEVTVRTTRSRALARLREKLTAMELADQRPTTRSGVTRITTRTVPSGSAGYDSPVYLTDSSRPPSSGSVAAPRISA
ncbi:MAG TPA: sigma-70 family RNA polymerase sigma factor [Mycobacteriales bacterium]|nr:sigma-70 family RNA polymerase sigma factor [Mycobacteriales bacterium]